MKLNEQKNQNENKPVAANKIIKLGSMSENESEKSPQENDDKKDEELDISSEKFDPLKALYAKDLKLPVQNVKKFDNLGIFVSRLKAAGNKLEAELTQFRPTNSKSKVPEPQNEEDSEAYHVTATGRRFLKEQAPIYRGKRAKHTRDLLVRMETPKGPLCLLQKFKSEKTKVKVYTRKEHGIRGFIIGTIVAFDKHYNLALTDCTETWTRRKFKFSEAKTSLPNPPKDCSELLKKLGIEIPEINVKSLNRKYVECTRKIGQLMVRGEDVILVREFKS